MDVTGRSFGEALLVSNRLYSLGRTECDMKSTSLAVQLMMDIDINNKIYKVYSVAEPSFGSVFSFSGEYSYFRFAGIDCSMETSVGPWETGSEGVSDANASRGSESGVRSIMDEIDCLIEPFMTGLGGMGELSCETGVSSWS